MLLAINDTLTGIRVDEADTFEKRLVGLIGKKKIVNGLFFRSCSSIHTFFMFCAIDVVFLDAGSRVTEVRTVAPFRALLPRKRVLNLLELPAGTAATLHLKAGDTVSFGDLKQP